ncbi:MAG: hypothetical protein NUV53_03135 [Patescibacteria group bacterium]|nr:hypothetical protein [Patescibacteria group bacterium]
MQNIISHSDQQKIWEEKHKNPYVLLLMDSNDASPFPQKKEAGCSSDFLVRIGFKKGSFV